MQKKYAAKGLVALAVHLDPPVDADVKNLVAKRLAKLNATTTTNFILDEPAEVWQEKLHSAFVPNVFVFGRDGKWTQFTVEGVDYEKIEKLVVQLLDQK
jgi:hypothetical protein